MLGTIFVSGNRKNAVILAILVNMAKGVHENVIATTIYTSFFVDYCVQSKSRILLHSFAILRSLLQAECKRLTIQHCVPA